MSSDLLPLPLPLPLLLLMRSRLALIASPFDDVLGAMQIYVQIVNNRSIETNAILLDANNTLLHKFRVRTHGYDYINENSPWPSYSNTIGLNQFSSNGATPTGLIVCLSFR